MKNQSTFTVLLISFLIVACNGGNQATGNNSTQEYANQIAQIKNSNSELRLIQQNLVDYYSKVEPTKTINLPDVTIDCVPFNQQPALINKNTEKISQINKELANKIVNQKPAKLTQFSLTPDDCPTGSVAIVRPPLNNIANGMLSAFNKQPSSNDDLSNYNWVQASESGNVNYGEYNLTLQAPSSTSSIFDANFNPTMVMPVLDGSHVINQSWWTSDNERPYLMTLETGLIKSAYFTQNETVSIFVFSTVSGYGPGPAGGCYNLSCGDFIQYPNTPALGVPITPTNGTYKFTYQAINQGYEMVLSFSSPTDNWSYPIGYYPRERYSTDNPLTDNPFVIYSAGAEIEAGNQVDQFYINGTLYAMYYNLTNILPIGDYFSPHNSQIYLGNIIWDSSINNNNLQFYTLGH